MSEYQTNENPNDGGFRRRWIPMDTRSAVVTYILIGINVLLFLIINALIRLTDMDELAVITLLGAKDNALIATGEYWRLITPIFLHSGLLHLFFNCYALLIWGPMVEKLYGRFKFVALYVIAGMVGCLFSYVMSINPSIGASGSIFGLLGALLYFRQRWKDAFKRFFGPSLFIIIGFNLFYGFTSTGIDNWGHIGGLVGGFLAGNALGLYHENKARMDKVIFALGIIALFAGGIKLGYDLNQGDVYNALDAGDYDTALAEVTDAVEEKSDNLRVKIAAVDVFNQRIAYFQQMGDMDAVNREINRMLRWYPEFQDQLR